MKQFFTDVVGNNKLKERLGNDVISSKLPHAIIFEGPRGSGKHTIARNCAAALSCENKDNKEFPLPCGKCISCRKILENKSPDVITVGREDRATIGVDSVRFLKEDVFVIPNDNEHKVYIIEEADKMTDEAQNAFLLTLEEPPAYVHFFLLCESANALLETIRSRAPILRTEILTSDRIDEYISSHDRRAAQMKLTSKDEYKELLAASGEGIGKALEYLDPKAFAPVKQQRALAYDFIRLAIRARGATETLPLLSKFSPKRDVLDEQLATIKSAIRDLIALKKDENAVILFYSDRETALETSDSVSTVYLYDLYKTVESTRDELRRNANVKLSLIKLALKSNILK